MADEAEHRRIIRSFGLAWVALTTALAVHVADEAAHDFLSVYNPIAAALRARLPFLPLPIFTFPVWLAGLILAVLALLALSSLAFRGSVWIRRLAYPFAVVMLLNGLGHLGGSVYFGRWLPGVWSSPLLLLASVWLLWAARCAGRNHRPGPDGAPPPGPA